MGARQNVCFRRGRKFDPIRSDQMCWSKACRLKHYDEVRRALADEKKPKYVIKMVTTYPKEGKMLVSFFQRLTNMVDWVGESRIAEAKQFRTKREAQEALREIRDCISTTNRVLSVERRED